MDIENMMLRKAHTVLLAVDGHECVYDISKKVDISYCHTVKIITNLEIGKMITIDKEGRRNVIRLTDAGKEAQEHLFKLKEVIKYGYTSKNKN